MDASWATRLLQMASLLLVVVDYRSSSVCCTFAPGDVLDHCLKESGFVARLAPFRKGHSDIIRPFA
eukprot:6213700-Pleurochrysis_carterae.AAC.2